MYRDEMRHPEKQDRRLREERVERREYRRPQRPREFDDRPYHKPFPKPRISQITKMFMSKEDLVEYVNDIGANGNKKIDVYKIEDGLYKVVVVEKNNPNDVYDSEVE